MDKPPALTENRRIPSNDPRQDTLMTATPDELFAFLDTLGIRTTTKTHKAVFTVEESQDVRDGIPGGHTKNLFLKDKKGGLFLVTCREDRKIRLKDLEKEINARGRCSFGKPELLFETLGVTPGSVTLFALINDRAAQNIRFAIDKQLLEEEIVNGHPLHNEATTSISSLDVLRFVRACGHEPMIVDFDALEAKAEETA